MEKIVVSPLSPFAKMNRGAEPHPLQALTEGPNNRATKYVKQKWESKKMKWMNPQLELQTELIEHLDRKLARM